MNSLVADYGTSSGESDAEKSENEEAFTEENHGETIKLPKPSFDGSSTKNSVFSNPFVEAENAKKAILEKHVKMVQVPTKGKVEMINGKKICWNYRKGRCHFGHNCTFAHDTDLQTSKDGAESENQVQSLGENVTSQSAKINQTGGLNAADDTPPEDTEGKWENQPTAKRKRPGLTQGLVPGKKVKKFFKKTNANLL